MSTALQKIRKKYILWKGRVSNKPDEKHKFSKINKDKFLEKYKNSSEYEFISLFFLGLTGKVASIDGAINQQEELAIKAMVNTNKLYREKAIRLVIMGVEDKNSIRDIAKQMLPYLKDLPTKIEIVQSLLKLAIADGYLNTLEEFAIFEIMEVFSLEISVFRSILDNILNPKVIDDYEFFGIERDISENDVNVKYIEFAKTCHPDILPTDMAESQKNVMAMKFTRGADFFAKLKNHKTN